MRIRTSVASIAALIVTVGLLAGCYTPAVPEPTESPAASALPGPSPTASPATAPDLAALCDQLLPLETVQERFGDDTALHAGAGPSPVPAMAAWAALARGDLQCAWGSGGDPYWAANVVLLLRGDDSEFEQLRRSSDEYPNERERLDAIGTSVDWCYDGQECQFAAAAPDGGWVGLVLRPDAGGSLLDTATIRERWSSTIDAVIDAAPSVRSALQPADSTVSCSDLLSEDDARVLLGDEGAFVSDPRGWGEGGTFLTEKWHIAFNASGCIWASSQESDSITIYAVRAPSWARESAFENVVPQNEEFIGERLEIDGFDDAWLYRYVGAHDVSGIGGTYDLLRDGLWLEVTIGADQDPDQVLKTIATTMARAGT